MARKKQKLSDYETKTLAEIKHLSDTAYIPLFTKNLVNNKELIDYVGEKLTAGDNIQIDENDKISATDTKYTAGENISIVNNKVSYTGAPAATYNANHGLKLINSKLSSDITGTLGSKLEPVVFLNNSTLVSAGNTMDSILVTRHGHTGQVPKPHIYIGKDKFIITDGEAPTYYYENTETGDKKWATPSTAPSGYELIKPSEYSHIAINHDELQYVIIYSSFIKAMAGKEVIINLINRPNERTELWFFNDLSTDMTYAVYEQGITLMSNSIPENGYCKAVYYIRNQETPTVYDQYTDFRTGGKQPPFCGNVIATAQEYTYNRLYSTIRFIPSVDESSKLVSLVSTIY